MKSLYLVFLKPFIKKTAGIFLFAFLLSVSHLNGQYSFTALQGSFTPLSGGTNLSSIQTSGKVSGSINIGFAFRFNGKLYTQVKASTGGYLTFKINPYWDVNQISADSSIIGPLCYGAMSGAIGSATYKTEGTAPNRVFTMEWLNWKWNWNATSAGISFQAKLYETTNRIEFVYRQEVGALKDPYGHIGLVFQYPNKFMLLSNTSSSPIINTDYPPTISTRPANGQIYRFDEVITSEPSAHASNFTTINPQSVRVKWGDATGQNPPSRYLIKVSALGYDNIAAPEDGIEYPVDLDLKDGSGMVYVDQGKKSYTLWTDSTGSTTYYMKIFPLTNYFTHTNYKTDGVIPQLQVTTPFYEARKMSFSDLTTTSMIVKWLRGTGKGCVVFVKENGSGTALPQDNVTYSGNSAFKSGMQIGTSGWYCIYNGIGNSVDVTGLKGYTNYAFHVIEYTGTPGAEVYSKVDEPSAHLNQKNNLLSPLTHTVSGTIKSTVAWGDYDNDSDLDLLICGSNFSKIYKNNGNNSFSELAVSLPGVSFASAAWGDYDNDNDLDILLTGKNGSSGLTKIFRNNGNNTFSDQTTIQLANVYDGSVAWGDYNNDGKLDILLTGTTGTEYVSKIYRNNGNNTFAEHFVSGLPGVWGSSVAWGDYDNDMDLDILIAGLTVSNYITKVFRNEGEGIFKEQTGIQIKGIFYGFVNWADYNNDGFLDIFVSGGYDDYVTELYQNNGNNTFTEVTSSITEIKNSFGEWTDIDNDGDLDLFLAGVEKGGRIYENNPVGTMTEQSIPFPIIKNGDAAWGDIDNDGDLDMIMTGDTNDEATLLYRNDITTPNVAPSAPVGLVANMVAGKAELKWKHVRSDITPEKAMTYNVRVGTSPGGSDIVSPMSDISSGYRRIVDKGNAQHDTVFTLNNLKKGTYYCSVQAVDQSYAGGAFSGEQSFTYDFDYPSTALSFVNKSSTELKCYWQRGTSENCIVFAKENGSGVASPVNGQTYTANRKFGDGTQIGTTGWFCIYKGLLDSVTVTNLNAGYKSYGVHVIEYNGAAGAEVYSTITANSNPAQYEPLFFEQSSIVLTGVSGHTSAWGDYDNDGDLDIIVAGYNGSSGIVELYRNNSDNTFTKMPNTFAVDDVYDASWGDYDNDNDLDLLILSTFSSKVFENNGNGTFQEKVTLSDVFMGKGEWADFNNDGYKDIIIISSNGTKIYKNNRDKTFTLQIHTLPTFSNYGDVACGDYDNDGDLDILAAGLNGSTAITKVYKNEGNFTFTEQTGISLPGISNCDVQWADMDNDGDLDIVMSGADFNFYTKIYDNNGNNTFTVIAGTNFKELYRSSLAIADYDNDGYRDLIISGSIDGNDYYTILYRNNGNKTYSETKTVSFPGIQYGSINWGDYDNDNDLDLFMCGISATGRISKVFINNGYIFNAKPSKMSIPNFSLDGNDAKFTWGKPADNKTASTGLSYNLYVYSTSNSTYAKSGEAFPYGNAMDGRKLAASFGDIQYAAAGYVIKGLPAGDYKIAMQAVDAGFLGGSFYEISFSIFDLSIVSVNVAKGELLGTKNGMYYSLSSTDGSNGTWNSCSDNKTNVMFNTGGFDVWVRQGNNTKNKRKIATLDPQAASPAYTINFAAETTVENIPANVEYSYTYGSWGGDYGSGDPLLLTLNKTLYLRTKATASALPSAVQSIIIPARPAAPSFSIDFMAEKTSQNIPSTVEYSTESTMSGTSNGVGETLGVIPGQTFYFRIKATQTAFISAIQTLTLPTRPAAPSNLVVEDGANTFDWDMVPGFVEVTDYEYSTNGGNNWTMVNTKPISIGNINVSAGNFKLRVKSTSTRFKGLDAVSSLAFTTRITKIEEAGIRLYPNPATDVLYLENLPEKSTVYIFNMNGKLLIQKPVEEEKMKISFTDLPQGIYVLKIQTPLEEYQTKFTKQ